MPVYGGTQATSCPSVLHKHYKRRSHLLGEKHVLFRYVTACFCNLEQTQITWHQTLWSFIWGEKEQNSLQGWRVDILFTFSSALPGAASCYHESCLFPIMKQTPLSIHYIPMDVVVYCSVALEINISLVFHWENLSCSHISKKDLFDSDGWHKGMILKRCYKTLPLFHLSSSYGSRLSPSQCFPPWGRWKATCSSASTRQLCMKSLRMKLAGFATFALSCQSSSWWCATAAEQSGFWIPKSACSSERVRWHQRDDNLKSRGLFSVPCLTNEIHLELASEIAPVAICGWCLSVTLLSDRESSRMTGGISDVFHHLSRCIFLSEE